MAIKDSRQVRITPNDHGPILAVIIWFFMTMMILAVIFRMAIKLGIRGKLKLDDYVACAALVFGVAQSIAISIAVRDGIGKRDSVFPSQNAAKVEKAIYTSCLLFVVACGTAKISVFQFLHSLGASKRHKIAANIFIVVVLAWMIASVLALAFRCGTKAPWNALRNQCFNEFNFWAAIEAIDLITEIAIMIFPVILMRPVQIAFSKKVTVVVAFAFRIGVPITIIIRLLLLKSYYNSGPTDAFFNRIPSDEATQILISLSITTACVPALKPFLDTFDSGALNVELKRSGNGTYGSGNAYELHSRGKDRFSRSPGVLGSRYEADRTEYVVDISGEDGRSVRSGSGNSSEMIIKRTDEFTVTTTQLDMRTESTAERVQKFMNNRKP